MFALFALLSIAECPPLRAGDPVLLVVSESDAALAEHHAALELAVRTASLGKLELLPAKMTQEALTAEGGREERERAVVDARVVLERAEEKFRELDDEEALSLIARATTRLSALHHAPGAIELLARAHLLAGAIYLSRGRTDAARQRLQRALDLEPELSPPRDRFAPEVLAELAGVRASAGVRATGRLSVRSGREKNAVYLDGRKVGETPLHLEAVPAGNHLLRVSAPGETSAIESIQVTANEERVVEVMLVRDPEIAQLEQLDDRVRRGTGVGPLLELLSKRAGAERTLLAVVELASEPTASGTATIAATLIVERAGTARAKKIDRPSLADALDRALACANETPGKGELAPSLIGTLAVRPNVLRPVPEARSIHEEPWFWGAIFAVALVVGSSFVVARAAGGPPEAVEVTLIPRP
jgi:hypothetical protein